MAPEAEVKVTVNRRRGSPVFWPSALLLSFAWVLTEHSVLTDLIVYRTCLQVTVEINSTECSMLQNGASSPEAVDLETKVEPYASVIVMSNFLIRGILPVVVSLFLGSWSDRAGRKPLLLAGTGGMTLMYALLSLMCNWDISPWYLLLASIPADIVGGMHTVRLALVCLISDTVREKNRIVQMVHLETSVHCGIVLGGFAAPFIYKNYGYTYIFATGAICCGFAFTYIYFLIPETVENTSKESIRGIFKLSFVKDLVASCLVKREGFHRPVVWLSISAIILSVIVQRGNATINFLFTRAKLGWDVQHYSYFDAGHAVIRIVGFCVVSLCSRCSGAVSDMLFACIGLTSALGSAIAKSLAWQSWHMYLSACIEIFSGIIIPVMRSIISKFVPAQDAGKIFSLSVLLEILGGFGGPVMFTMIYSNYLPPIYPSPVFLFSASILIASLACLLCMEVSIRSHRKSTVYIPAAQEEDLRP